MPSQIDAALDVADFRSATSYLITAVDIANRLLNTAQPWRDLKSPDVNPRASHRLLSVVACACRTIATELLPFCPTGASVLVEQLGSDDATKPPEPVFIRLD